MLRMSSSNSEFLNYEKELDEIIVAYSYQKQRVVYSNQGTSRLQSQLLGVFHSNEGHGEIDFETMLH